MQEFLKKDNVLNTLFNAMPIIVLVVDAEGRVQALNNATQKLFGISSEEAIGQKGGDIFNCIYSKFDPRGCGFSSYCSSCDVRNTAMAAIEGNSVTRFKGKLEINTNDLITLLNLLISSAPLNIDGNNYAIVTIEDISNIVELEGLLPICSSCKKIKDDEGYWNQIERYIEKHSEAEFTHSFCPECIKKLFPSYAAATLE